MDAERTTPPQRVLVVSPTYCEAENVEEFLKRVRTGLPDADILVVDDASPDGTADLVERIGAELGRVEVVRRPGKEGLGPAYRAGFSEGIRRAYDVLVEIDADLSHDPSELGAFMAAIADGADLVIGSRYVDGGSIPHWPLVRRVISRVGCAYAGFALNVGLRDVTSGYRAYRSEVLQAVAYEHTRANGYAFQIELAYRIVQAGYRVDEVPIVFTDRVRGTSKMSKGIAIEAMLLVTRWGLIDLVRGRRWRRRS